MLNIFQLNFFLAVAESKSFSGAAQNLNMTQPGVSQQIRALEKQLGTQLFVRRGHGVDLTPAGADLIDPARRIVTLSETTELALRSRRGEISGRVRLGCGLSSAQYIAVAWLAEFRAECPDVTIQMEAIEPGPMLGALRAQELDGGLVLGRIRGRGLIHHRVLADPITLIVPLNHRWASPSELRRAVIEFLNRPAEPEPAALAFSPVGKRPKPASPRPVAESQAAGAASRVASAEAPAREGDPALATRHLGPTRRGRTMEAGLYVQGRTSRHLIENVGDENWVPAVKPMMLKDEPFVLEHGIGESHSDARRALNDVLEERGLSTRVLRVMLELPGPSAVAAAVAQGLGIGLVPQSIARLFVGQVAAVRIEGFSLVQHIYLIRDRKALNSPAVSAWWKFVESKVGGVRESPVQPESPLERGGGERLAGGQDGGSAWNGAEPPMGRSEPDHLLGQLPRDDTAEIPATIGG